MVPVFRIFLYLCPGDNLFYRIPACPRVRKVRTTQSAILPNGKVLRLNTVGTASATENIPSRFGVIRVKTRGKSPRLVAVMQHEGKPYGLKDQIYREQCRAGGYCKGCSPDARGVGRWRPPVMAIPDKWWKPEGRQQAGRNRILLTGLSPKCCIFWRGLGLGFGVRVSNF